MVFLMQFDGCCVPNPGEMGIGVVVKNEDNDIIIELSEPCGFGTNNQAEYNALIIGLEELLKIYNGRLVVQGDSELVINQMRGEWRTRNKNLVPLYNRAKYLEAKFQRQVSCEKICFWNNIFKYGEKYYSFHMMLS